jgi:23S rRNA (cytosine1962-C5)-methyltransferase
MLKILTTKASRDYELLDSGDGEKLERFGEYILRRPDPQALWGKSLSEKDWKGANAYFERVGESGKWRRKVNTPDEWRIEMLARPSDGAGLKFLIKPTAFKHTGLFPEQEPNWQWIIEKCKNQKSKCKITIQNSKIENKENTPIKILNLFGYTGGATLAGLSAGAEVTHVDSSKSAITWAKQNAEASGLAGAKVRWLEDDARKFVQREIKRGNKYDAIIMDPPAFGHGANKEIWKIEEDFLNLLDLCQQILSDNPLFFLINGYSAGYSAIAYENCLQPLIKKFGGSIECGELTIEETPRHQNSAGQAKSGRLLPAGIFARFTP